MKILHVIPSVGPLRGGPTQAVLDMIRALRSSGVEVELLTTNDNSHELLDVPLYKRTDYAGVPVWFFPRFSPPIAPIREFQAARGFSHWLTRHLNQYDALHVHSVFCYPATVAMAIARKQGIPYINQPHGLLGRLALQHSKLKKQLYLNLWDRANLDRSCCIQFTSEKEFEESQALKLAAPGQVIPLGLPSVTPIPNAKQQLRQKLGIVTDEPLILFMARFMPYKGLDYLIPALGKLVDASFQVILAGQGTPDYEAEIEALIQQNGLAHRVHRPGFVSGERKQLFLQGSDIFVAPSYFESFGISVLEAMAAGLMTVVTPGVGLASTIQQHQLGYVCDLDSVAIANTLRTCLEYPDQAKAIAHHAQQFILAHYNWTAISKRAIGVYQSITETAR